MINIIVGFGFGLISGVFIGLFLASYLISKDLKK